MEKRAIEKQSANINLLSSNSLKIPLKLIHLSPKTKLSKGSFRKFLLINVNKSTKTVAFLTFNQENL